MERWGLRGFCGVRWAGVEAWRLWCGGGEGWLGGGYQWGMVSAAEAAGKADILIKQPRAKSH